MNASNTRDSVNRMRNIELENARKTAAEWAERGDVIRQTAFGPEFTDLRREADRCYEIASAWRVLADYLRHI